MTEQTAAIELESYDQISSLISKDLAWYIVYEAALLAGEALHVEGDLNLPSNKRRLYNYAISVELTRLIQKHIFPGMKIVLTHQFYKEAMDYFALHVPSAPTFQLSGYLNYLDSWARHTEDWKTGRPHAFDDIEIIISDSVS